MLARTVGNEGDHQFQTAGRRKIREKERKNVRERKKLDFDISKDWDRFVCLFFSGPFQGMEPVYSAHKSVLLYRISIWGDK